MHKSRIHDYTQRARRFFCRLYECVDEMRADSENLGIRNDGCNLL